MKKRSIRYLISIFIIIFSFSCGFFVSESLSFYKEKPSFFYKIIGKESLEKNIDFRIFWDAWDLIEEKYVIKPDASQMIYGAISGLVSSLGDSFSNFLDPRATKEFKEDLNGRFEGIGAELGIKDKKLLVIAPLPETPAEKAGIRAGDWILKIDGKSSEFLTIDEAVNLIRGPKGTEVKITLLHEGSEEPEEIIIKRDTIIVKSVKLDFKDNVAYLDVNRFSDTTTAEVDEAAAEILIKKPKGVILDLRNNPGGYFDAAIDLVSFFVDSGVVVTEKYRDGEKKDFYARGGAKLKDFPLVVLVNKGSASASEIVAGAIQDYKKGVLIGEDTFGKGSVQEILGLADGSSIRLTVAKWFTPHNQSISDQGLRPDFKVEISDEDIKAGRDSQLDKALESFK